LVYFEQRVAQELRRALDRNFVGSTWLSKLGIARHLLARWDAAAFGAMIGLMAVFFGLIKIDEGIERLKTTRPFCIGAHVVMPIRKQECTLIGLFRVWLISSRAATPYARPLSSIGISSRDAQLVGIVPTRLRACRAKVRRFADAALTHEFV
jgi:hypothetical protein